METTYPHHYEGQEVHNRGRTLTGKENARKGSCEEREHNRAIREHNGEEPSLFTAVNRFSPESIPVEEGVRAGQKS
jgi:hypothetical protein